MQPYHISLTLVNLLTFCSLYIYFIDALSLLCVPPWADGTVMIFTIIAFSFLSLELIGEAFSRPWCYPTLVTTRFAYYPITATFINNGYVLVEAFSLLFTFLEILVAYNVIDLSVFVPVWSRNPKEEVRRNDSRSDELITSAWGT